MTPRRFSDSQCLCAFRDTAREVRESTAIKSGKTFHVKVHGLMGRKMEGGVDHDPLITLATAVRKVFQQKEPCNYLRVANVIKREADTSFSSWAAELSAEYKSILRGLRFDLVYQYEVISHREIFDAWLNGVVSHYDFEKRERYHELRRLFGVHVDIIVQQTTLLIAGRILELDDVIADWRAEPRLPRITGSPHTETLNGANRDADS